jgi:hypothetical protein
METKSKATSFLKSSHRRHGNILVDYTKRKMDIASQKNVKGVRSRDVMMNSSKNSLSERRYRHFEISFSSTSSSEFVTDHDVLRDELIDFYLKIPSRENRRGRNEDTLSGINRQSHCRRRKLKKKGIIQSVLDLN